ncbi:MAG: MMPL family transporter, partial [Spirochaetota bacterium]|nr:MMPL family transporter [Spirochaetota bacterium]
LQYFDQNTIQAGNNKIYFDSQRDKLFINLLSSILYYPTDKLTKFKNEAISKEELVNLISKTLMARLPLNKFELGEFIKEHIKDDEKLVKKVTNLFFPTKKEVKSFILDNIINDDLEAEKLANTIIETRPNINNLLLPYLKEYESSKITFYNKLLAWVFPHLSRKQSPVQVIEEFRHFLDKLPPKEKELIKLITPYVSNNNVVKLLVEALQTAFPLHYDKEMLKKWFTEKNLSKESYANLLAEVFLTKLPLVQNELKEFISIYITNQKKDELFSKLHNMLFYTDTELKEKKDIALNEKLVKDLYISADTKTTQILITPRLPDNAQQKNIDFLIRIKKILNAETTKLAKYGINYKFYVAGLPEMSAAFGRYIAEDLKIMLPILFVIVLLTMLYLFRSGWGMITPMLIVIISILGTLGITGYIGYELNNVTGMIPQILLAIGIADAIHILTLFFRELHHGKSKKESMIITIKMNFLPCFLTSTTTALGFISLLTSISPPIRVLGIVVAVGSMIAFAVTLALLPALLVVLPFSEKSTHHKERAMKWTRWLGHYVITHRNKILFTLSAITIIFSIFISVVKVDNNPTNYFKQGTYFRDAMDFVDERLKGANMIEVSINTVTLPNKVEKSKFENEILNKLSNDRDKELILRNYLSDKEKESYILSSDVSEKDKLMLIHLLKSKPIKYNLPNNSDGIKEPEFLKKIEQFQIYLENDGLKDIYITSRVEKINNIISKSQINDIKLVNLINAINLYLKGEGLKYFDFLKLFDNLIDHVNHLIVKPDELLTTTNELKKYLLDNETDLKISHTNSLVDIIKTINRRLHQDNIKYYAIPDSKNVLAQNLLQYTQSVPFGRDLNNQINTDQSAIRLTVRRPNAGSEENLRIVKKMEDYINKHLKDYDINITGRATIFSYTTPKVTKNMIMGLFTAIITITILLSFTFKSIKIGLLSLVPNVTPLLLMFGLVGITGTDFNMGLSMVAIIAMGIIVDDTIHFIAKYLKARRSEKSVVESVYKVFHDVGSAIIFTSVILTIGFGIGIFSNFLFNVK